MNLLETNLGSDYRVSISRLKRLLGKLYKPSSFFDTSDSTTDSDSAIRGTLVEEMLQGIDVETSGKYFFIDEDIKEPSQPIKNIFNSLIVDYPTFSSIPKEKMKEEADKENFGGGKYKEDTVYSKLQEYENYYNRQVDLLNNRDKIIVKKSIKDEAESFYLKAWQSSSYQNLFTAAKETYWQQEIHFVCEEIPCKGIIDLLIKTEGDIVYVVDIKTTELPVLKAFNMFRWDLQMGFYMEAVMQFFNDPNLRFIGLNVVISKDFQEPIFIEYKERDIETIFMGSENKEGISQLLQKYKHHVETNDWEMPANKTLKFRDLWI